VSTTVKLGLTLPSFVDDPEIPIRVARAAEAAGLDAVFVYDHLWRGDPPNRRPAIECFTLLGAVAAETSRIRIGTLVARATLRPPAVLAHCFATAQRVSSGRVIAGIGAGDSQSRAENEAFGLEFGTMADRIAALHDAVRSVAARDIPVWVGGRAEQVREMVALADGWNAWGGDVATYAREAALVREVAPRAVLTWAGLVVAGEDDDAAAAKAEQRGGTGAGQSPALVGGPVELARQFGEYLALGAEWVIAGPVDSSNPANAEILGEAATLLRANASGKEQ
jgi:alkanesulfonate monooxygenase SsuD/methylene tetrahydromethanopterin reductase-like flavin-dependent oxidoreductase (luciferase family)